MNLPFRPGTIGDSDFRHKLHMIRLLFGGGVLVVGGSWSRETGIGFPTIDSLFKRYIRGRLPVRLHLVLSIETSGSKANCGGHSGGRGPGAIGIVAIDRTGFHYCCVVEG